LHPSLKPLARTWEDGRLAIVQGVGYPNPSRSHFVSRDVWYTAHRNPADARGLGWLGRGLDEAKDRLAPGVFVGVGAVPVALRGHSRACVTLDDPRECRLAAELPLAGPAALTAGAVARSDDLLAYARRTALDATSTADLFARTKWASDGPRYPESVLGQRLQTVARAIKAGLSASTYYLTQGAGDVGEVGNYDTHANQLPIHAAVLAELAEGWAALLSDLQASRLGDRVALMAFSEFGRRVEENASRGGTDHGTAGPVLLAGGPVRGGLVGTAPKLLDLEDGDLKASLDFRRVYSAVLKNWLGVPPEFALARKFEPLPLFRSSAPLLVANGATANESLCGWPPLLDRGCWPRPRRIARPRCPVRSTGDGPRRAGPPGSRVMRSSGAGRRTAE
jgi:uncharacterized protein (DUF1501 family)